ncbi:hypothetical protein NBRC116494_32690 [Aurantivibrio plasticivorans]
MDNWIQRIFLGSALLGLPLTVCAQEEETHSGSSIDIEREVFELGAFVGIINIGDFSSELAYGITGEFQASEDFFLQYNFLQTDVDLSSFELSQTPYFTGDDRTYRHYDLLVGYKVFHGEMYPSKGKANLSSLYIVGGVGDTQFGDEERFTYTLGVGYQIALSRNYKFRADYRHYFYDSSIIQTEEKTRQSGFFSVGLNYLF